MKTRSDHDIALKVVGSVIDGWDPYCLLEGGSPPDEFHSEIESLVARIRQMHSPDDAAKEISRIFSAAFEPHFTPDACAAVGLQLYSRLRDAGLLVTSDA